MNFFALKAFQGFSEIPLLYWGFPDSSVGKESACNAGDPGSIPELGRSCGEGNGYSLQYSGLENSMGSLYSPWGHKEADTTEQLSLHFTSLLQEGLNWKKIIIFLAQHTTELRERRVEFQQKARGVFKFEILKTSVQKNHLRCWLQRQIPKTLSW